MTKHQIKKELLMIYIDIEIPPIYLAAMDEACEHAEKLDTVEVEKVTGAMIAFATGVSVLKGVLIGLLEKTTAEKVTVDYRGVTHVFEIDDPIFDMEFTFL